MPGVQFGFPIVPVVKKTSQPFPGIEDPGMKKIVSSLSQSPSPRGTPKAFTLARTIKSFIVSTVGAVRVHSNAAAPPTLVDMQVEFQCKSVVANNPSTYALSVGLLVSTVGVLSSGE